MVDPDAGYSTRGCLLPNIPPKKLLFRDHLELDRRFTDAFELSQDNAQILNSLAKSQQIGQSEEQIACCN
ncbi:hypothetical protein PPACK8108_LOCUS6932 [Phakopsora pachyrhizi]|uniref:Uncharacterized protein n=1 Tax=Phakopsora pachyrhizi TaxID=170000 RepID=A0AAV0ATZ5_PHAPC|nr:hypothetical protein PPACK8108_LOCUS6932 [Phakopsora pachyrhizi]